MPRAQLKRIAKLAGYGLVLASLIFLGTNLVQKFDEIRLTSWQVTDFAAITAASLVYILALVMLAVCWSVMLRDTGESRIVIASGVAVYSNAAVLKYLPGNVFHLVGRNVGSFAAERGHWRVASATIFEIILSLVSSLLLAALFFSFYSGPIPFWTARLMLPGICIVILGILLFPAIVDRIGRYLPSAVRQVRLPSNLSAALGFSFLSYSLIIAAAAIISETILPVTAIWQITAPTFLLAWFLGFIAPGSPGGLGIREAAIVLGLSTYCSNADALLFALVMRLVSTVADLGLFSIGKILKVLLQRHQNQ